MESCTNIKASSATRQRHRLRTKDTVPIIFNWESNAIQRCRSAINDKGIYILRGCFSVEKASLLYDRSSAIMAEKTFLWEPIDDDERRFMTPFPDSPFTYIMEDHLSHMGLTEYGTKLLANIRRTADKGPQRTHRDCTNIEYRSSAVPTCTAFIGIPSQHPNTEGYDANEEAAHLWVWLRRQYMATSIPRTSPSQYEPCIATRVSYRPLDVVVMHGTLPHAGGHYDTPTPRLFCRLISAEHPLPFTDDEGYEISTHCDMDICKLLPPPP